MKRDLYSLAVLSSRNIKLYFKDKITFLMSMLTPLILLVLFVLFLKSVYISSIKGILNGFDIVGESKLMSSFANHWLISSIIGTSSVTIAFCSSTIMIDDKINGAKNDFDVSPLKSGIKSLSYLVSTYVATLIILFTLLAVGLIFLAITGFQMTLESLLLTIAGLFLNCLFGSSLACIVNRFVKTQAAESAVATLVSSMYGFLCGAYMPINQFPKAIQNFCMMIPGTYGSNIFRQTIIGDSLDALTSSANLPPEGILAIRDGFDINMYFFGNKVTLGTDFLVLGVTCIVLVAICVLLSFIRFSPRKKPSARN